MMYSSVITGKCVCDFSGGSRILLRGGTPLRNGITDWWPDVNTICIRKPQVISEGGGGCTPLAPSP